MPATINFTKRTLENLPPAQPGKRDVYHDQKTPGLELRVTASGVRSFALRRRVRGGPPERVTLGRFPDMTVEQARKAADAARVVQSEGKAVNAVRRAEQARSVSLAEAHAAYIIVDVERLRDPMQRITDFILRAAGAKPSASVVSIRPPEAVEAAL